MLLIYTHKITQRNKTYRIKTNYYKRKKLLLLEKQRQYRKTHNFKDNQGWRFTPEYLEWKMGVYHKDNHTCQHCNKTPHVVYAHHIKSGTKYPESRYDVSNGVTLCYECHKKQHA